MKKNKQLYLNKPKVIYIGKTIWSEEKISDDSPAYYSAEHIREVADSLGMSGDAFIAQLNGISYAKWMKGGEE